MKACTACGSTDNGFYPDKTHADGLSSRCKECVKARRRDYYAKHPERVQAFNKRYYQAHKDQWREQGRNLRRRTLAAYGGACACCGETTQEFLGIDHKNNDGSAHRKELGGYGRSIYRWLEKQGFPTDGFQLLCHNCNMAKGLYGACPHFTAQVQALLESEPRL